MEARKATVREICMSSNDSNLAENSLGGLLIVESVVNESDALFHILRHTGSMETSSEQARKTPTSDGCD